MPRSIRKWVLPRKHQIGTWELLAAVCALRQIFERLTEDTEVLLFIDSTAALGTLLRGASRQMDWNSMVGEIWFQPALRGHFLTAWRVPSKLNMADLPSRVPKPEPIPKLTEQGFSEIDFEWPDKLDCLPFREP